MSDLSQKPRFVEGKDVIYQCRSNNWSGWAMELLDLAWKAECKLRKTTTNHVMISNDLGMTTTLAGRNSSNGARSRRDTMKVIDAQNEHRMRQAAEPVEEPKPDPAPEPVRAFIPDPDESLPGFDDPEPEPDTPTRIVPEPASEFQCNFHDGAPLKYGTQAQLDAHRKRSHWRCPKCKDWLKSNKSAGGHMGVKHGTNKPWESKANFKGKKPAAGSVNELLDDLRRGKPSPEFSKGGPPPEPKRNSNGTRRSGPIKDVELPDPEVLGAVLNDANKIGRIREILGDDPRIAALTAENAALRARAEEAETKLSLMKGKIREAQEAADL